MTKCILCKEKIEGYGHNAMPIKDGFCCDKCHLFAVIPKQMNDVYGFKVAEVEMPKWRK